MRQSLLKVSDWRTATIIGILAALIASFSIASSALLTTNVAYAWYRASDGFSHFPRAGGDIARTEIYRLTEALPDGFIRDSGRMFVTVMNVALYPIDLYIDKVCDTFDICT
jgi:hypothetical protein